MSGRFRIALGAAAFLLGGWTGASAQTGSAQITGIARDATGGVLPGVTVEAASPALIEKVRTVVTDGQGQYRILELRPGVYSVTFSLPGFASIKRDGIELTSNFTASVNADMKVGDVSETITVSGASPVVDVQNVVQQRVMTRDVLDVIPTGKYYNNYAVLTPGVVFRPNVTNSNADVGGNLGSTSAQTMIHGSRGTDQEILLDGMNVTTFHSTGVGTFNPTDGNLEEINMIIGNHSAESEVGGVRINLVPKDGGNTLHGSFLYQYTNPGWQTNNVDDDLIARGLVSPTKLVRQWDVGATLGGPVKRDTLWFFGAYRYFPNDRTVGGIFYAKDPKAFVYEPDTNRPGIQDSLMWDINGRATWQVAQKHKIAAFYDFNYSCDCHRYIAATRAPEASLYLEFGNKITQVTWSAPMTNRLLFDAAMSLFYWTDVRPGQPEATEIPIVEQSTGLLYRSRSESNSNSPGYNNTYRASMSYIKGPHSMKFGFTGRHQRILTEILPVIGDVQYRVLNGIPNQVTYSAAPYTSIDLYGPSIGLFAQDQWTAGRLTLNGGVRFDWLMNSYPDQSLPATRWMVARSFEGADVANWKDLSPRVSGSYDLFGNGRTAIKGSLNRYIVATGREIISTVNPVLASNNTTTRTWNDANGDRVVQGDPLNPDTNAELGPNANRNFGRTVVTFHADPDADRGFGVRAYNWEGSFGVQHELLPRVSVTGMYFRRWYGNFMVTENRAYTPADFDPFCITAPVDARLPNGGGYQVCGLYDVKPDRFGRVDNWRTRADNFGGQEENWNGIDLTMNARLGNGVILQGGVSSGALTTDECAIARSAPQADYASFSDNGAFSGNVPAATQVGDFCRVETPWLTQVKFVGSLPLPFGVNVSATYQSVPGAPIDANFVATNAMILPSLGRNLAAGATSNVQMQIVQRGTMYEERFQQVDVRFTKEFRFGATRIVGSFDLYNALNANTVIASNNTYSGTGAVWQRPQVIMAGRLAKVGAKVVF